MNTVKRLNSIVKATGKIFSVAALSTALIATSCTEVIKGARTNQTKSLEDEINEEIDWSRNTAHIGIDLEKELTGDHILYDLDKGPITLQDAYRFIDRLFDKAGKRIKVKKNYTEIEALKVSSAIHRLLKEEGFKYKDYSSWEYYLLGANLLSYGVARKKIDCVGYSLLYLGISEHLGLPMVGISVPGHLTLRWNLSDGSYINWEATVPAKCKDDFYISWKNISQNAVENGVYLRSLSKKEIIAQQYYNLSLVWKERRQFDKAMKALDKAIKLFPKYSDAYNLRGVIWKIRGQIDQAIGQYNTAIQFDPNFSDAYYNRANARLKIEDYEGTKEDLAILKNLDTGLAERLKYMIQGI